MNKKLLVIVLGSLIVIIGSILVFLVMRDKEASNTNGLLKIKGFSYHEPGSVSCAALTPGCGFCNGEVINKACYVTQEQFKEYKSLYSAVEAE